MPKYTQEQKILLEQTQQVAAGLAATFVPFCEIVVHDLLDPAHAILAIHNNLSGRQTGHPATELGLARMRDPAFAQIINYPNQFADGRPAKSTSIGIKDSQGKYIAALCINIDLTLFQAFQGMLNQFTTLQVPNTPLEKLDPASAESIRARIDLFAARLATTPRALKAQERRTLVQELKAAGLLNLRRAMHTVATHLGVSRASVYSYAK